MCLVAILLLSPQAFAESDESDVSYSASVLDVRRSINSYAVQEKLTLDEVEGTVVSASTALEYIEANRPDYFDEYPKRHEWMQKLADSEALAVRIEAPELKVDAFYIPEPVELDASHIQRGLVVNGQLTDAEKAARKKDEDPGDWNTDPEDAGHPLFNLSSSPDDETPLEDHTVGTTWNIR